MEQPTTFTIRLLGFPGLTKDAAIAAIQRAFSVDRDYALNFVERAPVKVKSSLEMEEAHRFGCVMLKLGADIAVIDQERGKEKIFRAAHALNPSSRNATIRTIQEFAAEMDLGGTFLFEDVAEKVMGKASDSMLDFSLPGPNPDAGKTGYFEDPAPAAEAAPKAPLEDPSFQIPGVKRLGAKRGESPETNISWDDFDADIPSLDESPKAIAIERHQHDSSAEIAKQAAHTQSLLSLDESREAEEADVGAERASGFPGEAKPALRGENEENGMSFGTRQQTLTTETVPIDDRPKCASCQASVREEAESCHMCGWDPVARRRSCIACGGTVRLLTGLELSFRGRILAAISGLVGLAAVYFVGASFGFGVIGVIAGMVMAIGVGAVFTQTSVRCASCSKPIDRKRLFPAERRRARRIKNGLLYIAGLGTLLSIGSGALMIGPTGPAPGMSLHSGMVVHHTELGTFNVQFPEGAMLEPYTGVAGEGPSGVAVRGYRAQIEGDDGIEAYYLYIDATPELREELTTQQTSGYEALLDRVLDPLRLTASGPFPTLAAGLTALEVKVNRGPTNEGRFLLCSHRTDVVAIGYLRSARSEFSEAVGISFLDSFSHESP